MYGVLIVRKNDIGLLYKIDLESMSKYFDNKDAFMEPTVSQYGGHMVMTNVHKPSKTKIINIDTRFKDDFNVHRNTNANVNLPESYALSVPQNYTFTLPERITEVRSLTVVNAEIPMSFNNICQNFGNNTFTISWEGGSTVVTIPDGQYSNNSSLMDAMNGIEGVSSALSNAGISDLSFNIVNNYGVFTNNSEGTYTITFNVSLTGDFDKYNLKSKLGWLLGFRNLSYTVGPSNSIKGECIIDLTGPKYLYLVIDEFSKGNQTSFLTPNSRGFTSKNVVSKITLDKTHFPLSNSVVLPANLFNGHLLSDNRSYTGKIDIQKLTVQLLNDYGVPVDLNGMDFSFAIEVVHE